MGTLQRQRRRNRLETMRIVDLPGVARSDGQACVRVARFACPANHITCTAFGDAMA